jgi:hypothetical protein
MWGKRLAEFLASQLPEHGVATGQFHREDWGWEIPVENDAFPMFIGCSNQLEPNAVAAVVRLPAHRAAH